MGMTALAVAAASAGGSAARGALQASDMAGLGSNPGRPVGTPLVLPNGARITVVEGFLGNDCKGPEVGAGDEELCVAVCREKREQGDDGKPESMSLPGGTIFIVRPPAGAVAEHQNVMLVQDVTVVAPVCKLGDPRDGPQPPPFPPTPDGAWSLVRTMCLNQQRRPPDEESDYELGLLTGNAQLKRIVDIIRGKSLDNDDAVDVVQDAIWDVTEGRGGLNRENLAQLEAL